MNKYFEVKAVNSDNELETLFGSFDRQDCIDEIECEKSNWKSEGFKKIKTVSRLTNEKPDNSVYENLVSKEDLKAFVKKESEGSIIDYINDGLIVKCGDGFLINDERILEDIKIMSHTNLLTDNHTIDSLLIQVEKLSNEIDCNGGLLKAWDNEKSELFASYETLVKYIDEVFYIICERDNLSVDHYYPIFEKTIKTILPNFTY